MVWVNLTPHSVKVLTPSGQMVEIPPSGQVARVSTKSTVVGFVDGVPVVQTEYGDVENLPPPENGTVYIVSTIVAQALDGRRPDVLAPDTGPDSAVRNESGHVVAVRRFQVF